MEIVGWVAEKFGSLIASEAGGRAFNEVLVLAGLKERDRTPEILAKLDEISGKASEILTRVNAVSKQLESLERTLNVSIGLAAAERSVGDARSAIRTHYGTAKTSAREGAKPRGTLAVSFLEVIEDAKSGPVDTAAFANSVIDSWDIAGKVNVIADAVGEGSGTSKPLLRLWAERLGTGADASITPERLLQSYLAFEAAFQQAIEPQLKGIILVVNARTLNGQSDEKVARTLADFRPGILRQADLFTTIVIEMVARFYKTLNLAFPALRKPTAEEQAILLRSALIDAVLREAVAEKPRGISGLSGIYGTLFCGNFDAHLADRHTFEKNEGFHVQRFAPDVIPIEWESSHEYPILRDYRSSELNAFCYHLRMTPGASLTDGNKLMLDITGNEPEVQMMEWYDLDTLDRAPARKEGGRYVLVGSFLVQRHLWSHLRAPGVVTTVPVSTPGFPQVVNGNQHRAGFRKEEQQQGHPLSKEGMLSQGTLDVHAAYREPQGDPVGYQIVFPLFAYRGEAHDLEIGVDVDVDISVYENATGNIQMGPRLGVYFGPAPSETKVFDSADHHWSGKGKKFGVRATARVRVGGSADARQYQLVLRVAVATKVRDLDPGWAKAKITYKVQNFRMRWV